MTKETEAPAGCLVRVRFPWGETVEALDELSLCFARVLGGEPRIVQVRP